MEKILLTILSLLLVVGCSKTEAQTYQFAEEFYNNGLPKSFNTYKISKGMMVLVNKTGWYEDGQVAGIRDFKNGKRDGLWTDYYKSGQVWMKKTQESGNCISEEYWNADGSVGGKDCHKRGELKQFRKINPDYLK